MNRIAVFDLDGTLIDTCAVDAECYVGALATTFGISGANDDWSVYDDVTDSGILTDLVTSARGWPPSIQEQASFITTFVTRLRSSERHRFAEVEGARTLVDSLPHMG